METVEITAGTLHLRPWQSYDVAVVAEALAVPDIARWAPGRRNGRLPKDAADWLATKQAEWVWGRGASFAVMDATTGEVYGDVSLRNIDETTAQIGYWTLPAARGRGVAVQGLEVVSRWAFGALGLTEISLHHAADNLPSCRVAERGGYPLTGPSPDGGHLHHRRATPGP